MLRKSFMFLSLFLVLSLIACQPKVHEITFETGFDGTINNSLIEDGKYLKLPTINREGHQFLGWYFGIDSGASLYNEKSPVTSSFTLYAKWRVNSYTVTFDTQGGTVINAISVLYDEMIEKPADPINNGFEFVGWSLDVDGETLYTFGRMPGQNIVLYAIWNAITLTGDGPDQAIPIMFDTLYEVFLAENKYVMFRFQPPTYGFYTIESFGEFDTYVYIYQRLDGAVDPITYDDLYQIASEDDFGDGQNFKITLELNSNIVYYIRVELFFMSFQSGTIQFKIH